MYHYSKTSKARLAQAEQDLQDIFNEVIKVMDVSVLEGHRDKATQNQYYASNLSQVQWPDSKHNSKPSKAVDVAPYPINWLDTEKFHFLAGVVFKIASEKGIKVRWGGDWDMDGDTTDQTFNDLVHFELI